MIDAKTFPAAFAAMDAAAAQLAGSEGFARCTD